MKAYVLAGMPGAGKEEFVNVARGMGFDILCMGDVVRMEATRRGIAPDDHGIGSFANSERQAHGYGIWARRTLPLLSGKDVIIDGSRGLAELEEFRKALGESVRLIAIHSSPRVRFVRLQRRGRKDAPRTWEEFVERDNRELSWGLGSLIALADIMVINEGTLDELRACVRQVLEDHV